MHRRDGLSYGEIAQRLSLTSPVVETYIAEALLMLVRIINGEPAERLNSGSILEAERASLSGIGSKSEDGLVIEQNTQISQ